MNLVLGSECYLQMATLYHVAVVVCCCGSGVVDNSSVVGLLSQSMFCTTQRPPTSY